MAAKLFEENLKTKLGATRMPITVSHYMRRLRVLNDGDIIPSMKFLMDFPTICRKIDTMGKATSTKVSYLTAVCATLSLFPKFSKIHRQYVEKTTGLNKVLVEQLDSNEKNQKQQVSIVPMQEILKAREAEKAKLSKGGTWDSQLSYLLLSLYTMIQPRRNKDYSEMFFVQDEPPTLDPAKNYYITSTDEFIFNNYKTAKAHGQQRAKVSKELADVIESYIERYMEVIPMDSHASEHPLLVLADGKRINPTNGITRILNKTFGKAIGSSALRHIFLSDKYGAILKEQKADAAMMAHSLEVQKQYTKID